MPRLLDLFCGGGGAAVGYHRAGFDEIVGVDIKPQPEYPFPIIVTEAIEFMVSLYEGGGAHWDGEHLYLSDFDVIHASPPCQRWTRAQRHRKNAEAHPDLITPLRPILNRLGLPYVIENVEFCDVLKEPVLLCGSQFDLDIQNHRFFETSWQLPNHQWPCRHGIWGRHRFPGTPQGNGKNPGAMVVNRMASGVTHDLLASAMGIDWIPSHGRQRPTNSLSEAIPPAFTQFIGEQFLAQSREAS